MSPQSNDGRKAFTAGAALNRAVRVQFSGGNVIVATAGVEGIGTTLESQNSGESVNVRLDNHSVEVTASGAIAQGGNCYGAAAGAVSATISGRRVGIALEAGTDGNIFEMMPIGVNS